MNEYGKNPGVGEDISQHSTHCRKHEGNKWIDLNIYNVKFLFLIPLLKFNMLYMFSYVIKYVMKCEFL